MACELLSRLRQMLRLQRAVWLALAAVSVLCVLNVARRPVHDLSGYPLPPYTARFLAALPQHTPVVCTHLSTFVDVNFYEHDRVDLLTPLDWPIALEAAARGASVSGAHEIETWKKLGYDADRIQPTAEILGRGQDFTVVTGEGDTLWLDRRVREDPRYTVQYLGPFQTPGYLLQLWSVHRR